MRFARQRFENPRYRSQRGDYRDSARISGRAQRGDAGMEPLMNYANGLGNRAPSVGAPSTNFVPNVAKNGNYPGPGIGTRLGRLA